MAELMDTVPFKTLVTQSSAVLLTHGVEVESSAVRGVVAHLVEVMAARVGMDAEEAVHLVTPEVVAEIVMKAVAESEREGASAHAVRPVRVDDSRVDVPVESLGHLVMAAAQAGKYAGVNEDGGLAAHLLDLATELGVALVRDHADGVVEVPVGVLDELAGLVDTVAGRVESEGWSICPCGERHEQAEVDEGVIEVMRRHADLARRLGG